jgi:DNA polymerase-1
MKKKERKPKDLIIDGNNWSHRAYHTVGSMKFGNKTMGTVFGFMNMLGGAIMKYKPEKVYVCWDGGRNPERLKIHPEYKLRTPKIDFDKDEFEKQIAAIRRLLFYLGIPQLHRKEREADDYIYALAKRKEKKTDHKIVICSGDKDFRQMVNKRIFIADENKGLITPVNFHSLFGIQPEQFVFYLSMVGDTSDNIPGVPGIGEKTALKIIDEYETLTNYNLNGLKHPKYEKIHYHIGFSTSLIDLGWFNRTHIKEKITEADYYKGKVKPSLNIERYKELALKWGLRKHRQPDYLNMFKK